MPKSKNELIEKLEEMRDAHRDGNSTYPDQRTTQAAVFKGAYEEAIAIVEAGEVRYSSQSLAEPAPIMWDEESGDLRNAFLLIPLPMPKVEVTAKHRKMAVIAVRSVFPGSVHSQEWFDSKVRITARALAELEASDG